MEEIEIADKKDWRELEPTYPLKIFLTVFYSLILVTGIMGNSITIRVTQVLKRNGYLQKNVTDHMVSLACSDLLVLLIGMPVELYSAIWFPFSTGEGNAACKIYNFLFEACSYATILNVATLSFERYVAICHPFRFKDLGGKRTSALITFAWLVSVLVALPLLVATGTQGHIPYLQDTPVQNLTFCTNLRERWVMYRVSIFVAFILYMIVLVGVAFMCRAMVLVLRKPLGSSDGGTNGVQRAPKHESSRVKTARKQTIIFLGLIVASLMVCWLPNQIRRLMMAAVPKSRWTSAYFQHYITLHPVADSFFYLSSVLNPFLYNLSSRQFREVFVQVLRCRLTIEHVNKRTLPSSRAASARSLQPLLIKSLRRGRANRSTMAQEKTPPTFTTFQSQSDSGIASNTLSLTEESDSILRTKTDVPSETEV
ncbi:G-protein coupled receptor 39 [Centropristis striata]|uniref:G-protein coupled receptor 39 n=1 Tax=Centropristis striata TaxID=184440 RepID=UPI0027E1C8DB|nr:G-protein coupled receptor 39 [Centropristis striata]